MPTSAIIPKINISNLAYEKFNAYILAAEGEVSGLGVVEACEDGSILITDLLLFEQSSTQSNTTLDPILLGRFMVNAVKQGFDIASFRVWWHSHASFAVGWSDTDEKTIKTLSKSNYLISIVGNKEGEFLSRIDIQQPIPLTIHSPDIWLTDDAESAVVSQETIAAEVRQKVKHTEEKYEEADKLPAAA